MLPATDVNGAARLAERLRSALAQHRIEGIGTITASFGVATFQWPESAESLVDRADTALYQAKRHGRNRVEVRVGAEASQEHIPQGADQFPTATTASNPV